VQVLLDALHGALVYHFMRVDGGLRDVLREVLLRALDHGDHPLTMDDGLDFSDYVCVQILLNDGLALDDAALGGRGGLLDVLLDVMHDVVVNGAVEDGLHLNHAVLADCLLHDWCSYDGLLLVYVTTRVEVLLVPSAGVEGVLLKPST